MTLTMAASVIEMSGCAKKAGGQGDNSDEPWFEYKQIDVREDVDLSIYDDGTVDVDFVGVIGDKVILTVSGAIVTEDEVGYMFSEEQLKMITYDKDGSNPEVTDLYAQLDEQFPEAVNLYRCIDGLSRVGDRIRIDFDTSGPAGVYYYCTYYDPVTGQFSELDEKTSWDEGMVNGYTYVTVNCDGYGVSVKETYDDQTFEATDMVICIESPDGEHSEISLKDVCPSIGMYTCNALFRLDDNKVLVKLSGPRSILYYQADIASKEISTYTGDTSVLESLFYWEGLYIEGIGNILRTSDGIRTVDLNEGTVGTFYDRNSSNMNLYLFDQLDVDYIDSDTLVITGHLAGEYDEMYSRCNLPCVYVLTRQETNPNSGKELITASSLYDISYEMAEGIRIFNEQSQTHRIVLDSRYNSFDVLYDVPGSDTELNGESMAYNRLMIDLMSGDGPDIIFDAYGLLQLCNDEYLLDLSDLALPSDIFTNVVDASRVNGKVYNIPLSFTVEGIITDRSLVTEGQTGFTFDQYDAFVHDVCNGTDPTNLRREDFFIACLRSSGISDFRSDEFWETAEYARDRYIEGFEPDEEYVHTVITEPVTENVYYFSLSNPFWTIENLRGDIGDKVMLGLPGIEERAPSININGSVAVSSCTSYADQCRELITILLDPEVQTGYRSSSSNPVTAEGTEQIITSVTGSFNSLMEYLTDLNDGYALSSFGYNCDHIDTNTYLSVYGTMIDSASGSSCIDVEQENIIREEIGAFFAGQKTREEISDIIEDRISTLANERG